LIGKVRHLPNRAIGSKPEEIVPYSNTSQKSFSVEITPNMQISQIINVLSNSDFGVAHFMAIVASVVIVDDVSSEPFSILPLIVADIVGSEVGV
jgi:hypothetical protein